MMWRLNLTTATMLVTFVCMIVAGIYPNKWTLLLVGTLTVAFSCMWAAWIEPKGGTGPG